MATDPRIYLAIGSVLSESVTTKISTAGAEYVAKVLFSSPVNWWRIVALLKRADLAGAIVKLTRKDFERISKDQYAEVANALFEELAKKPYLLLVHEAVMSPPDLELTVGEAVSDDWDDGSWNDQVANHYFGTLSSEIRTHVQELLTKHGLTVSTYKRNTEASILAASFVEDAQSNLLFRIYVPSGRLYEDELARLLDLFHDWLGAVKGQTVRQGGYKTPSGRVIEFYGESGTTPATVNIELNEFARFLSLLDDAKSAERMLQDLGLERRRAADLVAEYAKQARRVLLDTKHERVRRTLAIQQQLESELVDELPSVPAAEIAGWVEQLIPMSPFASSSLTRSLSSHATPAPRVIVQQQIFHHVEGVVAQNVNGSVALGTPADQLIQLVRELGGESMNELEAATRELSDSGAPTSARISARQRLKDFLLRNGQRMEAAAFQTLWRWLEGQIGS